MRNKGAFGCILFSELTGMEKGPQNVCLREGHELGEENMVLWNILLLSGSIMKSVY